MRKLIALLAGLTMGLVMLFTAVPAHATAPYVVCGTAGGPGPTELHADSASTTTWTVNPFTDGDHYEPFGTYPDPWSFDGAANSVMYGSYWEPTYALVASSVAARYHVKYSASGMTDTVCTYDYITPSTSNFNVWDDFESASDASALTGRTPPVTVNSHTWTDYNGVLSVEDNGTDGDNTAIGAVGPNGKKFLYSYVDQDQDGDYTLTSLIHLSPTTQRAAPGIMGNWYDDDNQIWAKVEVTQQWSNGKLIVGTQEDVTLPGPTYGAGVIHSTRCSQGSLGLANGDWIWLQLAVDEAAGANGRDLWSAKVWDASQATLPWYVNPGDSMTPGTGFAYQDTPLGSCSYELDAEEQAGFGDRGEGVGLRYKIDGTGATPEDDGLSEWGIFTSIDS